MLILTIQDVIHRSVILLAQTRGMMIGRLTNDEDIDAWSICGVRVIWLLYTSFFFRRFASMNNQRG
jgi:hypothetical protein